MTYSALIERFHQEAPHELRQEFYLFCLRRIIAHLACFFRKYRHSEQLRELLSLPNLDRYDLIPMYRDVVKRLYTSEPCSRRDPPAGYVLNQAQRGFTDYEYYTPMYAQQAAYHANAVVGAHSYSGCPVSRLRETTFQEVWIRCRWERGRLPSIEAIDDIIENHLLL